jgi:hypothetical protein
MRVGRPEITEQLSEKLKQPGLYPNPTKTRHF